ncbi:TOBE domain-containing protein [Tolypothrix bouteillei VB521301]|uniref:TOBE domain-containing protein n=1 Tax=Tolypothrix bouteillei VB521301 TaxID=1479485 RepID=A0A8S9TE77_9CYAN|nr:TOBE domain-containing protein [Tolypothrix bouteillei VB521301]
MKRRQLFAFIRLAVASLLLVSGLRWFDPSPAIAQSNANLLISAAASLKDTLEEVNDEIEIEIAPGVAVTAIITKTSVEKLGLQEGKQAYAIIKASDVIVSVD